MSSSDASRWGKETQRCVLEEWGAEAGAAERVWRSGVRVKVWSPKRVYVIPERQGTGRQRSRRNRKGLGAVLIKWVNMPSSVREAGARGKWTIIIAHGSITNYLRLETLDTSGS